MIRLLVTGWRNATMIRDGLHIAESLTSAIALHRLVTGGAVLRRWRDNPGDDVRLVHGACRGVDAIAVVHARRWGWAVEAHPAENHPHRDFGSWPAAGPRRNAHMVSLGADIVVGIPGPGSRGTIQCVGLAIKVGLLAIVCPIPHTPQAGNTLVPAHDDRRALCERKSSL